MRYLIAEGLQGGGYQLTDVLIVFNYINTRQAFSLQISRRGELFFSIPRPPAFVNKELSEPSADVIGGAFVHGGVEDLGGFAVLHHFAD